MPVTSRSNEITPGIRNLCFITSSSCKKKLKLHLLVERIAMAERIVKKRKTTREMATTRLVIPTPSITRGGGRKGRATSTITVERRYGTSQLPLKISLCAFFCIEVPHLTELVVSCISGSSTGDKVYYLLL